MPTELLETMSEWLPAGAVLVSIGRAVLFFVGGVALAWVVGYLVRRALARVATPERAVLGRRVAFYTIVGLTLASALGELGFNLSVLLGAAGIVTVALGFASQTSASNLISGIFLVVERPFSVGDMITIGTTTGEVLAVDLLSVKIRTFDNLYVRVPNEAVMKAEITNLTRYPIRRADLLVQVAYKEDLDQVYRVLIEAADGLPQFLDEPRPDVMFSQYAASGVEVKLVAWTPVDGFYKARRVLAFAVKRRLDDEGIEIPFPHVSVYAGSATAELPVRLVGDRPT